MPFPQFPIFLRFSVRMLFCQVFLIFSSLSSHTPFCLSDSVIFVSEGSFLYPESPIYSSSQTLKKDSFKKWSKTVVKTSASRSSTLKSISSPVENTCYKSSPTSKHSVGLFFNSSSMAVIGTSSPVKLQQKAILFSFILLSVRRDKEKHITINHFGRPPPGIQLEV